jgi:hypothetical protein
VTRARRARAASFYRGATGRGRAGNCKDGRPRRPDRPRRGLGQDGLPRGLVTGPKRVWVRRVRGGQEVGR